MQSQIAKCLNLSNVAISKILKIYKQKVACLEEIAYEMGYISKEKLLELAEPLKKINMGSIYWLKQNNNFELN